MKWTPYHYRIKIIHKGNSEVNWLFLPGGPGFGSESIKDFAQDLEVEGSKYLIDFPGDGSNERGLLDLSVWREGLVDLVQQLKPVVLVTYSFSGMFALSIPELDQHLAGLVLMNTTPQKSTHDHTLNMQEKFNLPSLKAPWRQYVANPTQKSFIEFLKVYKNYFFLESEIKMGCHLMSRLPINQKSYEWSRLNFYPSYEANWVPEKFPCLIIGSEYDCICPLAPFQVDPQYQKPNIHIHEIPAAGHFPWLKKQADLQKLFKGYELDLSKERESAKAAERLLYQNK